MTTGSSVEATEPIAEPRSIDEIARITERSGYSLLTDEEIDRYVEWRSKIAVERANIESQTQTMQEAHDAYRKQAREAYERAEETFRRACEERARFEAVSDEQA